MTTYARHLHANFGVDSTDPAVLITGVESIGNFGKFLVKIIFGMPLNDVTTFWTSQRRKRFLS